MGLKRTPTAEEIEDIKKSLDFLTEETSAIKLQQKYILDIVKEIRSLHNQNAEKEKWIVYLESRVTDLEQYTRIKDVIIMGLKIKPRSYARAVIADSKEQHGELDACSAEQQVAGFLQSKGIDLDSNNIKACHLLPRKNVSDKPAVIRFVNRKHWNALLKQGRKLKGLNVYLNDHLTKYNADIAKKTRHLKKLGKIQNTWTANCKIFIKLNGTLEEAKVLVIKHIQDLEKY
ncbi:hypothetical protein ACER0C_013289 [Sarotherodon galilaeus]